MTSRPLYVHSTLTSLEKEEPAQVSVIELSGNHSFVTNAPTRGACAECEKYPLSGRCEPSKGVAKWMVTTRRLVSRDENHSILKLVDFGGTHRLARLPSGSSSHLNYVFEPA